MLNFNFLIGKKKPKSLYEYMRQKNIKTQRDLAEDLNISESYISYILSGKRSLGKNSALRISKETGIPLENLIQ